MRRATQYLRHSSGFSIVEALLAASMLGLVATALVGTLVYGQEAITTAGNRQRAYAVAEEGLEAVRSIRDGGGFTSIASNGTYGLTLSATNKWQLNGSSDMIDIYTRQVIISTIDANDKLVTVTVTWPENAQRIGSTSTSEVLSNWQAKQVNWASMVPTGTATTVGTPDGLKVTTYGQYAYIITSTTGTNFYIFNISLTTPVLVGSLTLAGIPSSVAISGQYAYVSSSSDTQELQVVSIATPALPTLAGSYNTLATADATSVRIVSTVAYLTFVASADKELYAINITTPTAPTLLSALELTATTNDLAVVGNYAYVMSADDAQEIKVVSVANPSNMMQVASLNLAGTIDATRVAATPTSLFVAQGTLINSISLSSPANPTFISNYTAAGTINDVTLSDTGNPLFVGTSALLTKLQTLNVVNPASMVLAGSFNVALSAATYNGVAYSPFINKVFAATSDDLAELVVIGPQ